MLEPAAFREPESRFRPAPFWAINDVLDPDEVERQARDLIAHGYSGGFFHSRHGLASPYMGDVWFDCLDRVLKVAKETGTYVYLYDEDLWPSGNAGGQIAAAGDAFRGRFMLGYLGAPTCQNPECKRLGYYRLRGRRGGSVEGFERVEGCQVGPADHELLYVCCHPDAKRGWWSGESYSNLLEPAVTQKFLELTFDRYAERLGEHFGKEVRAIFTDEPNPWPGPVSLPYAETLAQRFEAEYGEPMADGLPWLFLDGPGARTFRQRYRRMVNKVFLEAFTIPLGTWCRKHGIALTGHYLCEDSLFVQIRQGGGAIMPHYEHMQMPGIDHLCNTQIPALTMKQISSSLNQTGTPVALSELFGVSRHTATFEDLKWMADWHFANGVTFFCPHLTLYSFAGRRKRDYPPTFSDHQTYWPQIKPLHDYFARIAAAFDGTAQDVSVAVVHPIEAAYAEFRAPLKDDQRDLAQANPEVQDLDGKLSHLLDDLLAAHVTFDLIDERRLDPARDDWSVTEGVLRVGEQHYSTLIFPPARTFAPTTLAVAEQMADAVLFVGGVPAEVDCERSEAWGGLLDAGARVVPADGRFADEFAEPLLEICDGDGHPVRDVLLHCRRSDDGFVAFLANRSRVAGYDLDCTVRMDEDQTLAWFDAWTGGSAAIDPVRLDEGRALFCYHLPAAGSTLIALGRGTDIEGDALEDIIDSTRVLDLPLAGFTTDRENCLLIDRLEVSFDDGATWEGPMFDPKARKFVTEHFDVGEALQWQPWVAEKKKLFEGKGGPLVLRYRFASQIAGTDCPMSFVAEKLVGMTMTINGQAVSTQTDAWWIDRRFGRVDISRHVVAGENVVELRFDYGLGSEIEPAFVLGEFGVELPRPDVAEIVAKPDEFELGTWTNQGLPFYVGVGWYRFEFDLDELPEKLADLQVRDPSAILLEVKLNGESIGLIPWRPWTLDLLASGRLTPGANTLEIGVISSLRNAFGPMHNSWGERERWVGPPAFEHRWTDAYILFDYGLNAVPQLRLA